MNKIIIKINNKTINNKNKVKFNNNNNTNFLINKYLKENLKLAHKNHINHRQELSQKIYKMCSFLN